MCMLHFMIQVFENCSCKWKKIFKSNITYSVSIRSSLLLWEIPKLPKQQLFFLKMCPITRWGVIYVLVLSHASPLTKRSQKISQIPFFRHSERGKSRTAVCLAIASLTRREEARICTTHSFWEGKEEALMRGFENQATESSTWWGSETPAGISSASFITQPFTTIETAVHQNKAVSKKCQNRSNIVQQRPSSVDYLIVLS